MKILLVTQYFWPETFIINEIVRKIGAAGHSVTVLTGKPNYPDGKIFDGYEEKGISREDFAENIEVIRVPLRPRKENRSLQLILNYISFVWSGLVHFPRLVRHQQYDLVFALQLSPITSVIPAIFLSWRKKIPLITWVQDLWPESLAATGHIRNPLILSIVAYLVKWIYRHCDLILVQSKAFVGYIRKIIPSANIAYYGNSISIEEENKSTESKDLEKKIRNLCPPNSFNLIFAGNIGKAQAIETLFEAARLLQDQPRFRMVFVGSGSMTPWLEGKITEHKINNIRLAGRFPQSDMQYFYARADALLVSLKREDIFALTVPTKIQSYLGAGKPIIAALEGEGAKIVEEAGAGFACGAEDAISLASCIRSVMKLSRTARQKMGKNGRKYFIEHYEMNKQVARLLEIFSSNLVSQDHKR